MKKLDALAALAALSQDNRLDVFRLLVEAGRDGMPAGSVAEALKLAPNTLKPMLESMDMVAYIDGLGTPILVGPQRSELAAWATATADKSAPLTWPRYSLLGLPEFGTIAAHDHYVIRKQKRLGDFVELRAMTREYIDALIPNLEALDRLIESPTAVNGKLSLDDIRVLPLLRSAAVVKGLSFPKKVRDYFETMMNHIGYRPLPTV